jgi:hypothetical protein
LLPRSAIYALARSLVVFLLSNTRYFNRDYIITHTV